MNNIGLNKCPRTFLIVSFALLFSRYRSENSDIICTESTTAMGIRKMAIIDDIMCTVKPRAIRAPMVISTVDIATIMAALIKRILRKKTQSNAKITAAANGAEIPICTNISKPNWSSATGKPVMCQSSPLSRVLILSRSCSASA